MADASYDLCAPWAGVEDLVAPCCVGGYTDETAMETALAGASLILYHLTDRRFPGECTDTIRPLAERGETPNWTPYILPGRAAIPSWSLPYGLWGMCGCNRTDVCGCSSVSEISLPGYPVTSVTSVKIDGDDVPSTRYRLMNRSKLVYVPDPTGVDPRTGWPCCQDLTKATTEDGTWEVTYKWGAAPPPLGKEYAAVLACQIHRSMHPGDGECRLPERVQTITRQGITVAILDNFKVFVDGMTGLPEIDLWLQAMRYGKASGRRSRVFLPDRVAARRRDTP